MLHLTSFNFDELVKQCMAITEAALNTEHPTQRKLLLYVLSEKQKELAEKLAGITVEDVPCE